MWVTGSVAERRVGWLVVLVGALLALAIQVAQPVGVPLYDGVVVAEPYRYLSPGPGQPGDPTSFESEPRITEPGVTPVFAAATTESVPQAQLIARRDAFRLTPGATGMRVSITAVPPAVPAPEDRAIAGNVYRISVTDQSGNTLAANPCQDCRSLLLRAPETTGAGILMRIDNGAWVEIPTEHIPTTGTYQSNVDVVGDFAIVTGAGGGAGGGDLTLIVLGGGIVLIIVAFVVLLALRQRPAPVVVRPAGRGGRSGAIPSRLPSKRRGSRRPQPPASPGKPNDSSERPDR